MWRATSLCPDTTGPKSQRNSQLLMEGMPFLAFRRQNEFVWLSWLCLETLQSKIAMPFVLTFVNVNSSHCQLGRLASHLSGFDSCFYQAFMSPV